MISEKNYRWGSPHVDLDQLIGLTISSIRGLSVESEEVLFTLSDGKEFKMYHEQDCCETVYLADICGEESDLIDAKIVHFEERTNQGESDWGSCTHTFYDIQTNKGCVNLRWVGESNGYYSEYVSIKWPEVTKPKK